MNRISNLLLFFIITFNTFAQKNDSLLIKADKEFASLSYKNGVAKAFENFLADDAVFLSSTPLPIEGKTNFMKLFAGTKSTVIWQPTGAFKDKSGTSGYTYGLSKWIYKSSDSLATSYYVYNTNWIKDDFEKWKVITDIGTEISLEVYPLISKSNFQLTKTPNPVISKKIKEKNHEVLFFCFESARKGVVPAVLVTPTKENLKALVCYQHGIGNEYNKEFFLEEARMLAENGIGCLMIDAPFNRKGESFIESGGMRDAEIFENNCVEWLQAVKCVENLKFKTSKFFFVGQSYGARVAAFMPYLDPRFNKFVVISGIYNYSEWLQTTIVKQIVELRNSISPSDFRSYIKSIAGYDASIYLNKKNDFDFYFQAGTKDETLSEYDILSCYEMTNCKKKIQWYNTTHNLEKRAITDRIEQIISWANEN